MLYFGGCSLVNLGQMGHGGVLRDHQGSLVRDFSKPTGMALALKWSSLL